MIIQDFLFRKCREGHNVYVSACPKSGTSGCRLCYMFVFRSFFVHKLGR